VLALHETSLDLPGFLAATTPLNPGMVLVGLAIVVLVSLSARRRSRRMTNASEARGSEQAALLRQERCHIEDAEDAMIRLEQVSRELHGQAGTLLVRLERAIRDADDRLARLERRCGTVSSPTLRREDGSEVEATLRSASI